MRRCVEEDAGGVRLGDAARPRPRGGSEAEEKPWIHDWACSGLIVTYKNDPRRTINEVDEK